MSTQKMREDFEAAFKAENGYTPLHNHYGDGSEYESPYCNGAWWAWQASRAAIEVELRNAYMKGWEASGEGWNHEYPGMTHETELWQRERDQALGLDEKP